MDYCIGFSLSSFVVSVGVILCIAASGFYTLTNKNNNSVNEIDK